MKFNDDNGGKVKVYNSFTNSFDDASYMNA